MRLLFFLLIALLFLHLNSADSYTSCYNNCHTCSTTDFTSCSVSTSPCVYGYSLSGTNCNPVPSFNNYVTEFAGANVQQTPSGWTAGGISVTNTLTCNTIKQGQTIMLIGPQTNQQVQKTFTVAPRTTMFVQMYFLRINWSGSDSVTINILSGSSTIYSEIVTSTSYTASQNINYLSSCNGISAANLWGSQITLVSNTSSNDTSITVVFSPTITGSAAWAYSNIKVSTGCGGFMVSHGGTCNSCLSGYYYNSITLDCQKCHPLCTSCYGPTNTNCLSCPLESVLNGNTCVYSSNFLVLNDVVVDQGIAQFTSSCSNINMLGGPIYGQINNVLTRKYILPRHMLLKLSFWLIQIGDWSNVTSLNAAIDGVPYITINNFQNPSVSPLCLKQVGPVLVSTSQHYSNFMNHNRSETVLTFTITGTGSASTLYGINDISLVAFNCPPQCSECTITANFTPNCLRCNQFLSQTSGCLLCPNGFYLDTSNPYSTSCRKCYSTCLECNGPTQLNCTSCFAGYMLLGTYCTPNTSSSYTLYSQQLTNNVFNYRDYSSNGGGDFRCGNYRLYGSSAAAPITISRKWSGLPNHKGLVINMQVFKLGPWNNGTNIILKLDNNQVISIPINESSGSNVCSSGNSDFIYTLSVPLNEHTLNSLSMEISGRGGLAIGNVILSLQNCPDCASGQFGYEVQYIPVYSLSNSVYGLNTWLKFNKNVGDVSRLAQNFQVYINAIPLNVTDWDNINDLRLYTPLPYNYSFINGTLTILNKDPSKVISESNINIPPQELTTIRSQTKVARYDSLVNEDYLIPVAQLYSMFKGYAEAALYMSISFIGIGLGLVVEELVAAIQIVFMHIYVMTNWLPATLKLPLSGMWRIQHLNYFMRRDINRIQGAILPKNLHQISPHPLEQYHTDINFVRASYPIFVLNLIYIAYWIIIYTLFKCCAGFRKSPNIIVRWFREIVERPLNFFDYLFRLQFITVAWSCFCQFRHFNASSVTSFRNFNYFWTIIFFVGLCLYPFIIVCYLLRIRGILLKETFNYIYQDIFFMRIKRNHDEMSSFIYIFIRFLRYFIICCFMAFFASESLVGPILCMVMTVVQTLFILFRSIYVDPFYLLFKLVQNLFLFLLDIIYIVIFATANRWSLSSYLNLGYVADAFIVVILINGSLRALYLLYLKIRIFCSRNYRLDRAYSPASLGFNYRPPGGMEMALMPGSQKFGVPSQVLLGSNVGLDGLGNVGPFGGMNNMGMNSMGMNNMGMNPRISGVEVMNMGGVMNMNNQITSVPMGVRSSGLNGVGVNQQMYQMQSYGVSGGRQGIGSTQSIQFNMHNNLSSHNLDGMIANGANNALGRGSIQGGNLMMTSNVGGYRGEYAGGLGANYIEPNQEQMSSITTHNRVVRNSRVIR